MCPVYFPDSILEHSPSRQEHNIPSASHGDVFLSEPSSMLLDIGQNNAGATHIFSNSDRKLNPSDDQGHANCYPQWTGLATESSMLNYTQTIDINYSATTQRQDLTLLRRSHERAQKRKGKRLYASRYMPGTSESANTRTTNGSNDAPLGQSPVYYCTVCPKAFKNVYGWRRHEASVHGFHTTEWVCMLNGAIIDGVNCAFCSELFPELDHDEQHSILKCLSKAENERTFLRKDAMKQHIQHVHIADMETPAKREFRVPDTWCRDVEAERSDPRSLWCGICQLTFETTANRMDHVAEHFSNGADMRKWLPRPGY
jgi:hypothetical protein